MTTKKTKSPVASAEDAPRVRVKLGRPTVLTEELAEQLLTMAATGVGQRVAARAVGVSPSTLSNWLARGKASKPGDESMVEFVERWKDATARGEADLVQYIRDAASRTWQAATWLLERRYPKRWGKPKDAAEDDLAKLSDEEIERRIKELRAADPDPRLARLAELEAAEAERQQQQQEGRQ